MKHLTFLIHHLRAFAHTDYQAQYWDQVKQNELWLAALNHILKK
jgi:hypothetical protein